MKKRNSDAHLIKRIARFLTDEALGDVGEYPPYDPDVDRERIAKRIIQIVRRSDRRRKSGGKRKK